MPTLAIMFFIFIGLIFGIFLAYKLKQWHDDDRNLIENVDERMKNISDN